MKKTSLSDIANALSVSKTLVSLVLNNRGNELKISKKTQELVFNKAKELNYTPNFFAKGLKSGKTMTIALIISDISNPFYANLGKWIQEETIGSGYDLLIANTNNNVLTESKILTGLIQKSIDGIIIAAAAVEKNAYDEITKHQIPCVFIDRKPENDECFVGIDNYKESSQLINRLTNYKNIAIVCEAPYEISSIKERILGAEESCQKNVKKSTLHRLEENTSEKDYCDLIKQLISEKIDCLYALNNTVALKLLKAISTFKIEIPKTFGFVCFDDSEVFQYYVTPISAIQQPIELLGKKAVELLNKKINKELVESTLLPCYVIERDSVMFSE